MTAAPLLSLREETPDDAAAIRSVLLAAFPGPDEANLVEALRRDGEIVLSLVAVLADEVIGYVLFHRLPICDEQGRTQLVAASLAPLAVAPARQQQGVGAALVRAGLDRLKRLETPAVFVLGDENYYGRFGFSAATAAPIGSPYAGPHFQAVELAPGALHGVVGRVAYPRAFDSL